MDFDRMRGRTSAHRGPGSNLVRPGSGDGLLSEPLPVINGNSPGHRIRTMADNRRADASWKAVRRSIAGGRGQRPAGQTRRAGTSLTAAPVSAMAIAAPIIASA
jgi:hypothetical protein